MATHDLGLSAEQFYGLTPRQFHALAKRVNAQRKHTEFLHAQQVWATIAFAFAPPKKPVTPAQFMPSEQKPSAAPKKKLTETQIAANVRALFSGLAAASKR